MLTDDELDDLYLPGRPDSHHAPAYIKAFARAVIAAYEAKLREQKPVAWMEWHEEHESWFLAYSQNNAVTNKPLFEHPAPSAPEGWQQFSHTLKYLIGTWREGKGMFPQESDRYDESIAAAHLLLKEADWQQGRYFPMLAAAARSE